jgi:O-antigen ligase
MSSRSLKLALAPSIPRFPQRFPNVPRRAIVAGIAAAIFAGIAAGVGGATSPTVAISALIAVILLITPFVFPALALVLLLLAGRFGLAPVVENYLDIAFWSLLGLTAAAHRSPRFDRSFAIHLRRPTGALLRRGVAFSGPAWILGTFLVFAGMVAASLIETSHSSYGLEKTFRVVVYGTAFILLPQVYARTWTHLERFLVWLMVFALGIATVSLLLAIQKYGPLGFQRIDSPGGGPITLARMLGYGSIASFGLALVRKQWLYAISGIYLAMICFFTGSRGPTLFLALTLLLTVPLTAIHRQTRRQALRLVFVFTILGTIGVAVFQYAASQNAPFIERFQLLGQADKGGSIGERGSYFGLTLDYSEQRNWLGYGSGGWALEITGKDEIDYPHNVFLEALFEQGLLGLIAVSVFLTTVGVVGTLLLFSPGLSRQGFLCLLIMLLGFVYALLVAQTSGDFYDNRYCWFFAGMIAACARLAAQEQHDERKAMPG